MTTTEGESDGDGVEWVLGSGERGAGSGSDWGAGVVGVCGKRGGVREYCVCLSVCLSVCLFVGNIKSSISSYSPAYKPS